MSKSAGRGHPSPASSLAAYVFQGPAQVAIRTRTNDQPRYVDTRLNVWTWCDALMLAVSLASPSELEESAQRLKEVMKKPAGARRRRVPPPEFAR